MSSPPRKVSEPTVRRLSTYLRILERLSAKGTETASSDRLAELGGLTSAQVRKDLSVFGNFGIRGRGYDVADLHAALTRILGLDRDWPTVVVGAGRLGSALTAYPNFLKSGFRIVALFDADPALAGRRLGDIEIRPVEEVTDWVRENSVTLAIISTPAKAAQRVANQVVAGGIRGILNFTPTPLDVPDGVTLREVNLTIELEGLAYATLEATPDESGSGPKGEPA